MGALAGAGVSVEQYIAMDDSAEVRSEYHDGEVFPLVESSVAHGFLTASITRRLGDQLDGTPCRVSSSSLRVRVGATRYVYPDLSVICGKPTLAHGPGESITNPKLIVEVLSPATRDYDYGRKFDYYRSLPSLEEYLLVEQDEPRVGVRRRTATNTWEFLSFEGLDATLTIASLGISIPLAQLYEGIDFPPPVAED